MENARTLPPQASDRWALPFIAGFWFLLWLGGFPLPMCDDLFYIGAALNMGAGGTFTNPYCLSVQLYQDHYYIYVPFHSYVLAAWIKAFGPGHGSLPAFQCLMSAVASTGLWRLMRGPGTGLLLPTGICVTLAIYFSSLGLRPDVLAMALLVWGMIALRGESRWAWFAASLLLGLSIITCPNFAVLAIFIGGLAFVSLQPGAGLAVLMRKEGGRLALSLGAGLIVAGLFLWMIDFQPRQFWVTLNSNRQVAQHNSGLQAMVSLAMQNGRNAARFLVQVLSPLALLVAVLSVAWRFRGRLSEVVSGRFLVLTFIAGLLLYIPALTSATATRLPLTYAVLAGLFVVCLWQGRGRWWLAGVWGGVSLFFLFAVGHLLMEWALLPLAPSARPAEEIRREIAARQPQNIYVDHFSARWVYDYRLPPHSYDFFNGRPHAERNMYFIFLPDSVFVASRETVLFARPDLTARYPAPVRSALLQAFFPTWDSNPYDCVVVPGDVPPATPAP